MGKFGLLERLNAGDVIIGDGGFVFALEKRGYVKAGPWTPEVNIEHPDAVRELHREFLHAGADVMQTLTFYASDDKLENRGNKAKDLYTGEAINNAACEIAKGVASERPGTLVAGGICQTPSYLDGRGKEAVQSEFRKQLDVFIRHNVDFLVCEYFEHIEEMEWAIEVAVKTGKPVVATMCIGPQGDMSGTSTGECGIRMAKAGACCIGVNCHFDPLTCVKAVRAMKDACDANGLRGKVHYICQPLAYHTPDCSKQGFIALPEFPFALEPRIVTRWDIQNYARRAYEAGIRYIGGCCGFEPYHIRAITEELIAEKRAAYSKVAGAGAEWPLPFSLTKHGIWASELKIHTKPFVRARASRQYWETLKPASGRPFSASLSRPSDLVLGHACMKPGDKILKQHTSETTAEELAEVVKVFKPMESAGDHGAIANGENVNGSAGDGHNLLLDF